MFEHRFSAPLWEWNGKGSWHFITVPQDISGIIRMSVPQKAGFGSVRVVAETKGTRWKTSLFPDSKTGCYLLPIKSEVRKQAALTIGDDLDIGMSIAE